MNNQKICSQCKIEKFLNEFYIDKRAIDRKSSWCIQCHKNYSKNNKSKISIYKKLYNKNNRKKLNIYRKEYRRKYPWKETLYHIKQRCNNKNHIHFKHYGGRDIKCLITEDELKKLWFRDKAYEMKKPSIDRIDNDGNYEFNNCRFIEKDINCSKDKCKSVFQYDLQGNFIKKWISAAEIEKKLGYSNSVISSVCLGKYKNKYGFIWRFKDGK